MFLQLNALVGARDDFVQGVGTLRLEGLHYAARSSGESIGAVGCHNPLEFLWWRDRVVGGAGVLDEGDGIPSSDLGTAEAHSHILDVALQGCDVCGQGD